MHRIIYVSECTLFEKKQIYSTVLLDVCKQDLIYKLNKMLPEQ